MTAAKHTSREFITFLTELVERAERAQETHVVLDNLSGLHRFENVLNRRYRIDEFASSLVTIPGSNRGHPSASRGHHLLSTVFRSAVISRRCGGTDVVRAPPSAAPASPSDNRRLRDGSLLRFGDLVLGRRLGEELHQRAVHFVRVSPNHCVRSIFNDQEFGALHQLRRAMPSG